LSSSVSLVVQSVNFGEETMRFSIRDLLWATVVVAMALGWGESYLAINARRLDAVQQARTLHANLSLAKRSSYIVNWSILDEPLVEP
jgi:hypothetical protein